MILVADSGSTKTDWAALDKGVVLARVQTKGMNPFFQTSEELAVELRSALLPALPKGNVHAVFFYGAGCTAEKSPAVAAVLRDVLKVKGEVEVHSDLFGAARALCGRQEGIACILGTGSNSCFYDGNSIVENVSPLGFILGDEGSGAVLGRLLVGELLKNTTLSSLRDDFLAEYSLTTAEIIDRVYRKPFPNRFLASFSPFIAQHQCVPQIHDLVLQSFKAFLKRNVARYPGSGVFPVHFVGSIACYFQPILMQALDECRMQLGQIRQSPMEGLIAYHQDKGQTIWSSLFSRR